MSIFGSAVFQMIPGGDITQSWCQCGTFGLHVEALNVGKVQCCK
jgi:hypothetical protein